MPRISRYELLDRQLVDQLQAIIADPGNPGYVKMRAMGTLNAFRKRQDKVAAEKAKAAHARKAERDAANHVFPRSALPRNGREPEGWPPNGYRSRL